MKVRVSFTVDIDTEAWAATYGVEGASAIRQDVQNHAKHTVFGLFGENDLLREV